MGMQFLNRGPKNGFVADKKKYVEIDFTYLLMEVIKRHPCYKCN